MRHFLSGGDHLHWRPLVRGPVSRTPPPYKVCISVRRTQTSTLCDVQYRLKWGLKGSYLRKLQFFSITFSLCRARVQTKSGGNLETVLRLICIGNGPQRSFGDDLHLFFCRRQLFRRVLEPSPRIPETVLLILYKR